MASVRLSPMSSSIHVHDTDIGGGGESICDVRFDYNENNNKVLIEPTWDALATSIENGDRLRIHGLGAEGAFVQGEVKRSKYGDDIRLFRYAANPNAGYTEMNLTFFLYTVDSANGEVKTFRKDIT